MAAMIVGPLLAVVVGLPFGWVLGMFRRPER
jgi:ABC-type nitrate/sulfonate/bicarbonate transport system permease component